MQEPTFFPRLQVNFADFPYTRYTKQFRLWTLETWCGLRYEHQINPNYFWPVFDLINQGQPTKKFPQKDFIERENKLIPNSKKRNSLKGKQYHFLFYLIMRAIKKKSKIKKLNIFFSSKTYPKRRTTRTRPQKKKKYIILLSLPEEIFPDKLW